MSQTKHQIQSLLEGAEATPRQRFGQNFMIDQNLVRLVAEAGRIERGDLVVEIGPGTGTLTEELLATGADIVAVEIDRALAEILRGRFGATKNFSLIFGDALAGKHELNAELLAAVRAAKGKGGAVKLVANLPYNIASPLIIELLIAGVDLLAFTVQKEVADRLRSGPGSKEYGTLSIMVQLLSKVEVIRTLPPQAFWPMPKISSALVRLTREDRIGGNAGEFSRFVTRIFSSRRKTLRNAISMAGMEEEMLDRAGVDGGVRPEELKPENYLRMFEEGMKRERGD
jgi:16S rRNA (adenine1518-N6/adenine1519-N6)-dimethyltransferase